MGPTQKRYDVVIVGGAVMGSSVAWHLTRDPGFDGSVLVVERDSTYEFASTSLTNSCMRQQFTNELNIRISQYAAEVVRAFDPPVDVHHFGYMYLADDEEFAAALRASQEIQAAHGAGTRIMSPEEIAAAYPFYEVGDLVCGSHNLIDEGWFDSQTMFQTWRREARAVGVEYLEDEVVALEVVGDRVASVRLASGIDVGCGTLVNAAGPRAAAVAAMAGLELPVEPRKRYTFVFEAAEPLDRDLPLTIDTTGVHVRTDGGAYMAGCTPDIDPAAPFDDFAMDHDIWEDKVWPALVHRIPAFERIRVRSQWAGHYAFNTVDHNVVVGPHARVQNFVFVNGFSGHGMQQSPAMGRGVAELIAYGGYRTLDLTPLGHDRIVRGEPFAEGAII